MVNNRISMSGSQVGVINTGDLAKIDAVVTITNGSDAEAFGQCFKEFAKP